MRCPVCDAVNYSGDDFCTNCGADLAHADAPQPATTFHGRLLGAHLDELGAPAPTVVEASATVASTVDRMHREGLDCVLVTDRGRLVGIFTDRDAVLDRKSVV